MVVRLPLEEEISVLVSFAEHFETVFRGIEHHALRIENQIQARHSMDSLGNAVSDLYHAAISSNVAPLIEPLDTLRGVVRRLGELDHCPTQFAQLLLMFFDRFDSMVRQAVTQKSVDFALIKTVQEAIAPLARLSTLDGIETCMANSMRLLLGEFVNSDEEVPGVELFFTDTYTKDPPPVAAARNADGGASKSIIRVLADTVDIRHRYWFGRTSFLLSLALGINAVAGMPEDIFELEAAVCLHDFPMVRFNDDLLYAKSLDVDQIAALRTHPALAYELVLALGRSEACARMVYQHHERPDGAGYPEGVGGSAICAGAKMLAICDAFYAMTHARPQREGRRGVIRAIAEINACRGSQFDATFVDAFNVVVRTERMAGTW